MERPNSVRVGIPKDGAQIFSLLCQLHTENAMFPKDDDKVWHFINKALNQDGGIMGVIEDNGQIVGVIGMYIEQFWYSSQPYLCEYFNYVKPEARKSNHAKDLIDFAKWANTNMGLLLIIGIMSSIRTKAKLHLYNKRLSFIGGIFVNGLPSMTDFMKIDIPDKY